MSSETAGYVESLLGEPERSSFSMQWLVSRAHDREMFTGACRMTGKLGTACQKKWREWREWRERQRKTMRSVSRSSRNSKILFYRNPELLKIRYRCQFELGVSENHSRLSQKWFPSPAAAVFELSRSGQILTCLHPAQESVQKIKFLEAFVSAVKAGSFGSMHARAMSQYSVLGLPSLARPVDLNLPAVYLGKRTER